MNLEKAIELVLNEAESSALGDSSNDVLDACDVIQAFYDEYGYKHSNFTIDKETEVV